MPISKKDEKILRTIKKKIGITETGVKKWFNDNGLRISPYTTKRFIIEIGGIPKVFLSVKGKSFGDNEVFVKEVNKFIQFMGYLGRKTITPNDINKFTSIRYY